MSAPSGESDRLARSAQDRSCGSRVHAFLLALVFLTALALRLLASPNGGPPHDFVPDEHAVGRSLQMLKDRDPFPSGGSEVAYPHGTAWGLAVLYAIGIALRTGLDPHRLAAFESDLLADPFWAFWVARVFSACCGAAAVLVARRLALRLGASPAGGLLAAALLAFAPLQLQLASQARPWSLLVLLLLWSCERAACVFADPRRGCAGVAIAAALAATVHPLGFVAWVPFAAALLVARVGRLRRVLLVVPATLVTASAYPGLLLGRAARPDAFAEAPLTLGGQGLFLRFDGSRAAEVLGAWSASELVGISFLLWSLASRWRRGAPLERRSPERAARLLCAGLALALGLLFTLYFGTLPRYFLPTGALLGALSAAWIAPRDQRLGRGALVFAVLALLASFATCARLSWVLSRPDTRVLASLAAVEVDPFHRFAVEAGGPRLTWDRRSLNRLARHDPEGLSRVERARVEGRLDPDTTHLPPGLAGVPLERLFRTRELVSWKPGYAALWRREGRPEPAGDTERLERTLSVEAITDVLRVRRYPGDESERLMAWLGAKGARLRASFDPGTADARLPGEVHLGWWTYWTAERSGPRVEWWER